MKTMNATAEPPPEPPRPAGRHIVVTATTTFTAGNGGNVTIRWVHPPVPVEPGQP